MIHDQEREDLLDLAKHPGWLRVKAWAESEYGPSILTRVATEEDEAKALIKLRQATAIKGAIETLLGFPERRVTAITSARAQEERDYSLSRGGVR